MNDCYDFHEGTLPLIVSVPHDGRRLPEEFAQVMTAEGLALPDTDWHVARLYDFAKDLGASMLVAKYSRYVVDLNRSPSDDALYEGLPATGLCPRLTFAGKAIYLRSASIDVQARVERYWEPYHERLEAELERMRRAFGHALLWDAHSIPSRVPRLFEGELPVLNLGTYDGQSAAARIAQPVVDAAERSKFAWVRDARFKGGFITRHYGDPRRGVHAIQLELAQRAYMDEATLEFDAAKAAKIRVTLKDLLGTCVQAAARE